MPHRTQNLGPSNSDGLEWLQSRMTCRAAPEPLVPELEALGLQGPVIWPPVCAKVRGLLPQHLKAFADYRFCSVYEATPGTLQNIRYTAHVIGVYLAAW